MAEENAAPREMTEDQIIAEMTDELVKREEDNEEGEKAPQIENKEQIEEEEVASKDAEGEEQDPDAELVEALEDDSEAEEGWTVAEKTVPVEVNGQTLNVAVDDLKASYVKQTDTINAQKQIAINQEALAQEYQKIAGERQFLSQQYEQLKKMPGPAGDVLTLPEITRLMQDDPLQGTQEMVKYQTEQERLRVIGEQQQQLHQLTAQQEQRQTYADMQKTHEFMMTDQKAKELFPAYGDAEKRVAKLNDLEKCAKEFGFQPEEIEMVARDPRQLLVLSAASELMRIKGKIKAGKGKKKAPVKAQKAGAANQLTSEQKKTNSKAKKGPITPKDMERIMYEDELAKM